MPKGGHSNLLLQWMEYMACLFLFQEISTHRTETIYQHTRFQTYTTMPVSYTHLTLPTTSRV